jgi:phosphoribosylformylglycinamidine synthase subunit PurQ / glutaminase
MSTPRALVLTGYGINCDFETKAAFEQAGAKADRVHLNDLIENPWKLDDYQILAFPGGFSYGDDVASGRVLAVRGKATLGDRIVEFFEKDKLIIGICNGFQVMAKFGLVSNKSDDLLTQRVTVTFNDSGRFEDRWVKLVGASDKSVWTRGIDEIYLPVAHGEGKFFAEPEVVKSIESSGQVVFRYAAQSGDPAGGKYPDNPNGSLNDIAGICDPSGRAMGMMPHPERFLHFTNHPDWTRKKEETKRMGKVLAEEGEGLKIFRNGVNYFN